MPGTTKAHRIAKFLNPVPQVGPITTQVAVEYFEAYRGRSLPNFVLRVLLNPEARIPCIDARRRIRIARRYKEVYL